MPRLRITHTTTYTYDRPVRLLPHRLMTRPRDSHDLRLLEATLGFTPAAGGTRWAHDVFGNSICHAAFGEEPTEKLEIVSTLELEHFPAPETAIELDPGAERFPVAYAHGEFPDLARSLERHYPDPEHVVDGWARSFLSEDGQTAPLEALTAMTHAVKADFTYAARAAEGTNPPAETLATKSGACRDFALLMMEAARSLGLAARFVSGYLYDADDAGAMTGGGATHAWCDIYLPGAGWVEFDPTNGLVAGRNLIRVCVARAPEQAVPVAGGFIGDVATTSSLAVDVKVALLDPPPPAEAKPVPDPETPAAA